MKQIARTMIAKISSELAARNKEVARALPDSKGGETPKQLQTYRTDIYTYFTIGDGQTHLLYSAENWVRVTLELETAGPVAIGTSLNIAPVLSGRGVLLNVDRPFQRHLPKGTRLHIISETVNRVNVTIEPIPWLEQLSLDTVRSAQTVASAMANAAGRIVAAFQEGRQGSGGVTSSLPSLPSAPPVAISRARLTGITGPKRMR